jgi:predicted transcriptional regulator
MISALWEEETQIALHTNTEKHDYSEVESRAKACFRWCKENFGTSKIWQHKNEKAHLKRQKNIEIVKVYKSAGLKQKEIAKKLGLSIAAVKKYYSEIKKDTNLTFDDIAWKYEHISKGRKFYETEEDRIEETGDSIEEKDRRKNDAERIFDLRLFPTFQRKDNDCTRVCASDTVLEEHGLCTDWDYEIFADKWVRSKFLGKEDA